MWFSQSMERHIRKNKIMVPFTDRLGEYRKASPVRTDSEARRLAYYLYMNLKPRDRCAKVLQSPFHPHSFAGMNASNHTDSHSALVRLLPDKHVDYLGAIVMQCQCHAEGIGNASSQWRPLLDFKIIAIAHTCSSL